MPDFRPAAVNRRLRSLRGERAPVGWVFMVGQRPWGPLRPTREAALQDAVEAGEASVCLEYGRVFLQPLTWVAPVWP
ncbi:hypothetical protein ACFOMD_01985 [Sphingoaurantiacus capsulatus]|uniref:Uncharacterized protein n=1 Tax=Sphingoaurantiacus capsulatus TaxID=1771310 RepID=A0ABV7X5V7_9SPHN